ncbi:hypothetical protein [Streptomonospora litoralis]|nr:hypothetical protein [Streptomonospora litoralis]
MRRTRSGRAALGTGKGAWWAARASWRIASRACGGRLGVLGGRVFWRRQRERLLDWAWLGRQRVDAWQAGVGDLAAAGFWWLRARAHALAARLRSGELRPWERTTALVLLRGLIWLTGPLEHLAPLLERDPLPPPHPPTETAATEKRRRGRRVGDRVTPGTPATNRTEEKDRFVSQTPPNQRILDLAEELKAEIVKEPEGMLDVLATLKGVEQMQETLSGAVGTLKQRLADDYPSTAAVVEGVELAQTQMATAGECCTEAREGFEEQHPDEIERLENQRRREDMWDTVNNHR